MFFFISILIDAGAGILSVLPFLILLEVLIRKLIPFLPLKHLIGCGIFCGFLSVVLSVTGVPAIYEMQLDININLLPFVDLTSNTLQYIENILLFLPAGALLPLLYKKFQKLSRCALYGFLFSLAIELMQLFCFRTTDLDDLLTNTLGTIAGFGIFALLQKLYPPVADEFSIPAEKAEKLPALFELEVHFLTAAAWAGALLLTPVIKNIIWALVLSARS